MNRKNIPLLMMLIAGAITCIITFIKNTSIIFKLSSLLIVLLIFYFFGSLIKFLLDYFEQKNEKDNKEKGEVIEKEADGTAKDEAKKSESA